MDQNLMVAKAIVTNPAFESKDITGDGKAETFCNWALRLYANACYNITIFDNLNANAIYDLLATKHRKVNTEEAHKRVMAGSFVIAAQKANGNGHVAVLVPEPMVASGKWGKSVPQCANVGKKNGIMGVNHAFSTEPDYFVV